MKKPNEYNPLVLQWERMAELWSKVDGSIAGITSLPVQEITEFKHILKANLEYWHRMAILKNMSYVAHITDDTEEQHKICAAIEEMEETGTSSYTYLNN